MKKLQLLYNKIKGSSGKYIIHSAIDVENVNAAEYYYPAGRSLLNHSLSPIKVLKTEIIVQQSLQLTFPIIAKAFIIYLPCIRIEKKNSYRP